MANEPLTLGYKKSKTNNKFNVNKKNQRWRQTEVISRLKMKKLSKPQQEIVDLLKKYPTAYVIKSPYYNHNDVVLPKEQTEYPHFKQFTRSTFEFLERNGIIKYLEGKKYILAEN